MRRPTPTELFVMRNCFEGLRLDIDALSERGDDALYDVLGTFGVNLSVLHGVHSKLSNETATYGMPQATREEQRPAVDPDMSTHPPTCRCTCASYRPIVGAKNGDDVRCEVDGRPIEHPHVCLPKLAEKT